MPEHHAPAAPVRAFWSGTITFGLVSIPVDFYAAARARDTSMKMVDAQGHPLGRRYTSASDGKPLDDDEIVRGYETDSGKAVVITEAEFESAAPETSRDIDLLRFVPLQQVPPASFVRPYFLAPTQRAGKAYSLLAQTMERTGKAGIGRLVMRGHEYLVAIIAEHGALRAETLRYVDELRTPEAIGLPAPTRVTAAKVEEFTREIDRALEKRLDLHELEDRDAEALEQLARSKLKAHKDVVTLPETAEDEEPDEGGAQIIDLVQLLRNSLGGEVKATPGAAAKHARVSHADSGGELASMTREQLARLATDLGIAGRSKMDKGALVKAVQAARRRKAA
ncbi:Ku protein [Ramlibacter ginsenosidimutans]|uniref:Ku protein n=1 Tax=Ramlibacter ginsenosidimutans TaxID=502333 RepID=A0A934WN57_9BURK|nr:Ku protein [Ramlibacter ginsenosidimutans]